ncbi:MAG TPA: GNA1162 family protein [Bryobacteraceae bacterium]|nr:GNA1162 family protein [Bryobacteraceae bacterium]
MLNSQPAFAIGLIVTSLGLAGCTGKIRYPSYYALDVPAPPSSSRPKPILGSVAVKEFSAPRILREGPIVYRPSPDQVDFYVYHRWAEDPRREVTAAMMNELRARGIFQSVDVFDGHGSIDCVLTGTLDHLEEVDRGNDVSTEVSVSARLINLRTGEVLWQDTSSKTSKLDQRSVPGIVAELSRDLGNVVKSLVASMQDRLASQPVAPSAGQ